MYAVTMKKGQLRKEQLQKLIKRGLSLRQMAEELGRSRTNICYWMRRYSLKTQHFVPKTTAQAWSNESAARLSTNKRGDVGLGQAMAWFLSKGFSVSVPLTESQPYDLVVDDGARLHRVEVRYTGAKDKHNFVVKLSTSNLTASGHKTRFLDRTKVDLLFAVTSKLDLFLIPTSELSGHRVAVLGPKYESCRVFMESEPDKRTGPGC
jgi:hypothetical protein